MIWFDVMRKIYRCTKILNDPFNGKSRLDLFISSNTLVEMLRNFASKLINVSSLRLRKQNLQYNMLSTVARNTIHITFVDEDVSF